MILPLKMLITAVIIDNKGTSKTNPNNDLFWTPEKSGTTFFKRLILSDPKIKSLIREYWTDFQTIHLDNLMRHIEDYTFIINGAKARNRVLWNRDLVTDERVMKR